ncbi:hypothetical protein F2P81_010859 [Scophthalmus maximus]|uniref:C2H2-type domain-containing protein n=1 Tax=Scophthalmus maximus TaxID=52904 RepID=A0A6A4SYY1_SCOMX|nr:hypothetical protein F2P81_010859 [Scophthalmus maximus]
MSDPETLAVTFRAQLSDVMGTLVKAAVYEVTRLVEDGLLEEVRRRGRETESLRLRLQWTERRRGGRGGGKTGTCVDCARRDVELSTDMADAGSKEQQDGRSPKHTVIGRSAGDDADPVLSQDLTLSLVSRCVEATEEEEVVPAVDVKEEEVNKPSCSSLHLGEWSDALDGKAGLESQSATEKTEAQPKQTMENSEELLRNIIKQGPQISAAFCFPDELEEIHMTTDPSHVSSSEMDTSWAGLLQNHRLCTEKDHNPAKSPLKRTEHELQDSVAADVRARVSQSATSGSTKAGLQNSKASGVTIKQEVCEENEHLERKEMPKSGSVKPHRPSSEAHRQNHISHKATVQDVLKLHSRVGTGLKLQAAIQHLHRPMKNPPHVLSNSTTAALSIAHTQVVNLNPLNRIPSSSKAAPPPPLPAPRVHLGDKQPAALNRPGAPWARSQHQSANSHHADPVPHADSHSGPRHLLRCGQCGKCFPHPSNLKAHLQTHTGERPFCCSLCDRSFTKLSNLKAHRRVHTGERPYCCLACGKRFTQKCNLKRHQRIHLDM